MLKKNIHSKRFIASLMICSSVLSVMSPSITNIAHADSTPNTNQTKASTVNHTNPEQNNQKYQTNNKTAQNNNANNNQNNSGVVIKNSNSHSKNNNQKINVKNHKNSNVKNNHQNNPKNKKTISNTKAKNKTNNFQIIGNKNVKPSIKNSSNNKNNSNQKNVNNKQNQNTQLSNKDKSIIQAINKANKNDNKTKQNTKLLTQLKNKLNQQKKNARNQKNKKGINSTKLINTKISKSVQKPYQKTKQQQIKAKLQQEHDKLAAYQKRVQKLRHQFEKGVARTRSQMLVTPRRDVTPLPSRQYTIHRTHVVNPMFRTDREYQTMHRVYVSNGGHYKNTVPMTSTTAPARNLNNVKPYKGFDKSVLRYKPYLDKVCKHYGMQKYEILFLAIMENETKGNGQDVMQSSESAGLHTNSLNPQQSIEQAVRYMKSIVNKAHSMDMRERHSYMKPQDYHDYATDDALLAQSYNYGAGFLDYVSHSKTGYNVNVAQKYSKDVVAPRLGNTKGSTYSYNNPIAKMYKKNFLYTNGGNYLYGALVEQYMTNGTLLQPILQNLVKYSGKKYVWGGNNPKQGFDCQGLITYGLKKSFGLNFPSGTVNQWHATKPVRSLNASKPGDLVFFKGTFGSKHLISHVELVVDRDTMFGSDASGVGFHDIRQPYWMHHFAGVRRLPQANKLNKQVNNKLNKQVQRDTKY